MTDAAKENVIQLEEGGSVQIAEEVILTIAALAAEEEDGVTLSGGGEFLGKKNYSKAIRVTSAEAGTVMVDVSVLVTYGCAIQSVSMRLQERVKATMESMTGLAVKAVNVHVNGVTFEKDAKKEPKK